MRSKKQKPMTLIDRDAVLDRVGGDENLLREIIVIFLDECPALVASIRDALAKQDRRLLERSAHTLKGSLATFGADAATQAALELELSARRGDLHRAPALVARLEVELDFIRTALSSLHS
jgi:HPt (histidine-containing phosphotransfer) domain-containing protein